MVGADKVPLPQGSYVSLLRKRGVPLFEAGGVHWRNYQSALLPVEIDPCYLNLTPEDCAKLLRESGAWLLRYCSDPSERESEWYLVLCDRFDPSVLTGKMRYNIRYANRHCETRPVQALWLAEHGYDCYVAAYDRYVNAAPSSTTTSSSAEC